MAFDWAKHDVCYTNEEGGYLAVYPERCGLEVGWFDLSHHRLFEIAEVLADEPERFAFRDRLGREFTLRPMTLEVWNRIRTKVAPGNREYTSLARLREDIKAALGQIG
jgi:hypothetical protein